MKQMFCVRACPAGRTASLAGETVFLCPAVALVAHLGRALCPPPPGVPLPGPLFPAQHPTASKAEGRGYVDAAEQGA